jgi:hypothetical protein
VSAVAVEVAPEPGGWKVTVFSETTPVTIGHIDMPVDKHPAGDVGDVWYVSDTGHTRVHDGEKWLSYEQVRKLQNDGPWPFAERRLATRVISHRRRKSSAVLVGTGAAMALRCELRVKNRKGRYTTAAASFGGDSSRRNG